MTSALVRVCGRARVAEREDVQSDPRGFDSETQLTAAFAESAAGNLNPLGNSKNVSR